MTATASIFGRILTAVDVEQAAGALLQKWSSTYLSEVERQHGMKAGDLPRIRSWSTVNVFESWPADQLPASLLVSTGTVDRPLRSGDGVYRVRFALGIAVVAASNNAVRSNELAKLYIAAHRNILVQRPSLEFGGRGTDWIGDDYTSLPPEDGRFLSAGLSEFVVEFGDVASANAGPVTPDAPLDPDTLPWPAWQTVKTHTETIENVPPSEPLARQEGDADASGS